MLLINKISLRDFLNYKNEYINCLIHNANNDFISEVFVFIDGQNKDFPVHKKIKYIFRREFNDHEILEFSRGKTNYIKYLWTLRDFIGFNTDLSSISIEPKVFKNRDFFLINKDTKVNNNFVIESNTYTPNIKLVDFFPKINKIETLAQEETKNVQIDVKKVGNIILSSEEKSENKKLDVIIVSVNYNDYLLLSLSHNIKILENITVVTSSEDLMCQEICLKFGIRCIVTDCMYDNHSTFNKGKAINAGIKSLNNPGYILILDADVIIRGNINTEELDKNTLFTSDRWICQSYEKFLDISENFEDIEKYCKYEIDKGLGFFQLYHTSKEKYYPENSDNAAFDDLLHRDKFIKRKKLDIEVIHLGESYVNWNGRKTNRFLKDKEFWNLYNSIKKKFNVNDYFDNIYCLNLKRNSEKWENVSSEFQKHNIKVEHFLGIDGKNLDYGSYFNSYKQTSTGRIENKFALSCLLSHIEIIKDAKSKGYQKILIFEDDILISNDFEKRISEIENLNWHLLYLGASQFEWRNIKLENNYYNCHKTLGTFAFALRCEIYDEILELLESKRKSIDNLLQEFQIKNENKCFVLYPNIVISDVSKSDIRESKDMIEYSKLVKWSIDKFEYKSPIFVYENNSNNTKLKILLVPDRPGWAFDNISKSIIKYNPYIEQIQYDIVYVVELHAGKKVNLDDYDYIYVFWEAERIIPDSEKVIRGCYSAFWLENKKFSQKVLSEFFIKSGGVIFANDSLRDSMSEYLPNNLPMTIIEDSSDEELFYPILHQKNEKFTAIFVGNIKRKIKNFEIIQEICKETEIDLIVCVDLNNNELVNYYNKADICINFSEFEGGPQTFIEASLCEVPMLIRNNNELSKIIPCFTGDTKEEFINIINELKIDRNKCRIIGRKAKQVALENFTYRRASEKFGEFFLRLNTDYFNKKDLSEKLTVFVISCGKNPNYKDCLDSLYEQSVNFKIKKIRDVSPMSVAFQKMIDECQTEYYIQVDEDMILFKDTIEKIYESLVHSDNNVSTVAFMLKDVHLDFNLYGIKGYKHNILRNYPYNLEIISCEVEQVKRLQNDGYNTLMNSKVVGFHSPKWTDEIIFERYFDLMEKWKNFKYDWLGELPSKLIEIFRKDSSDLNFYAVMGALTSLSSNEKIRQREKNFKIKDENFQRIKLMSEKTDYKYIKNEDIEVINILTKNIFGK